MAPKVTPRPCLAECGRHVTGREKLCEDCASWCECGRRKYSDRAHCRTCAARKAQLERQLTGRGDSRPIRWVKNRRGIFVAR